MPRYDDRRGNTRLYVGHISLRTRARDLERLFSRYGSIIHLKYLSNDGLTVSGNRFRRIRDVDMKQDFAFVEFSNPRDADDARYSLDGRDFDGSHIVVEFARGVPRGSREYLGRGPPPGSGRCFNCGIDGHWARDCKAGDWKNKCYRCGERGHIERNCKNSPQKLKRRQRSYSRSPVRTRSPYRGRSCSQSNSRGQSYTQSRSPVRREQSIERGDRLYGPEPKSSPPLSKGRKYNPTHDGGDSLQESGSPSSQNGKFAAQQVKANYSDSPGSVSRSPTSPDRDESPARTQYRRPSNANGRSQGPSPRENNSPVDDEYDDPLTP